MFWFIFYICPLETDGQKQLIMVAYGTEKNGLEDRAE